MTNQVTKDDVYLKSEATIEDDYKPVTKIDPQKKTDQELLEIVVRRLSIPPGETGVTDLGVMESAIGALFVGQKYGLRILRIIHSSSTLRLYEKFLGISFEEVLPQHGYYIDRSYAWSIVSVSKKYWDLVARKFKMEPDEKRSLIDTASRVQ